MREVKFRAKRNDIDRWIYGQYFTTPLTDENSGTTPAAGWYFLTGEPRHCIVQNCVAFVIDLKTLGQYTGLKDKNGKEIYEGDIVNYEQHLTKKIICSEVYYNENVCAFGITNKNQRNLMCEMPVDFKIVGNIYANADLLEV